MNSAAPGSGTPSAWTSAIWARFEATRVVTHDSMSAGVVVFGLFDTLALASWQILSALVMNSALAIGALEGATVDPVAFAVVVTAVDAVVEDVPLVGGLGLPAAGQGQGPGQTDHSRHRHHSLHAHSSDSPEHGP